MPRYYVYNGDSICQTTPAPQSVYQFDLNSCSHGPNTFMGGTNTLPRLDATASMVDGFYVGYNLVDATIGETRTIMSYDGTTKECTLSSSFSMTWSASDTFSVEDPTNWYYIHMQSGASITPGAYDDYIIVDSVTRQFRFINSYNTQTKTALINVYLPMETLQ